MADVITLNVSSSPVFTCLLVYLITSVDLRPVQMVLAWVLPLLEISQVEVDFAWVPDPPIGYHTVLMGSGTYRIIGLHTVNSCSIVFFATLVQVYPAQKVCT
jgi:hypothetical protein